MRLRVLAAPSRLPMQYSYHTQRNWIRCHTQSERGTLAVPVASPDPGQLLFRGLPGTGNFPVPNASHSSSSVCSPWATETANTTTSVSTLRIIILWWPCWTARDACSSMRLSASSWLHRASLVRSGSHDLLRTASPSVLSSHIYSSSVFCLKSSLVSGTTLAAGTDNLLMLLVTGPISVVVWQVADGLRACIPRSSNDDNASIHSFTSKKGMLKEGDSSTMAGLLRCRCTGVVIYVIYRDSCEHFAKHFGRAGHLLYVKLLADTVPYLSRKPKNAVIEDAHAKV